MHAYLHKNKLFNLTTSVDNVNNDKKINAYQVIVLYLAQGY